MTPDRTDTEQGHAPDGDGHLAAEHELDQAALARALPAEDRPSAAPAEAPAAPAEAPTEPLAPPAAEAAALGPPPNGVLRRRTRILLGGLAAGLIFLGGIQCQKLTAGEPGPPGGQTSTEEAADTTAQAPGAAPRVVQGEIVALRGSVLYVREADGDIVRMEAGGASRVLRGTPSDLGTVRPGEIVVAELQPGGGEPAAISLTVLPPRERSP